jgi:hypothetical protein
LKATTKNPHPPPPRPALPPSKSNWKCGEKVSNVFSDFCDFFFLKMNILQILFNFAFVGNFFKTIYGWLKPMLVGS